MKKHKLVRDEWRVLSKKFVRHHLLPFGTRVILEHVSNSGQNRRQARNDLTVTRHLFRGRAQGTETVTDLFNLYLLPALTVNLAARGLEPKLVGPNGEEPNGNMHVKTVRGWPPLPTPDEIAAEEARDAEIEEIAQAADLDIRGAEEFRDDPDLVLRGFVRALVRRYGAAAVKAGIEPELGA